MHSSIAPRLIAALLTTFTLLWASAQSAVPATPATSASSALTASTPTLANGASMTTAPNGFVAPAEPKADDSNAERAKSQPGNNAPFWRGVRESGVEKGISNLPGAEKGVLIQEFVQYPGARLASAGEAWRQVRNKWIIPYGGSLFVITLLALGLFYFKMGSLGGHVPYTGRMIERFTYFERAAHWSNAIAFCALAISGLVIAFGKFLLLPVMGASLFGWLTFALKNVHNFAGPLFAVSLVVVFITFVRDNIPNLADLTWLRKGGGMFGGEEVPSGRFNAGEKVVFWGGIFALGSVVIASGLVLDELVPGMAYLRGDMQIANMVHGTATVLMMAMFAAHIYLGTIGMKDAYSGMKTGMVDEGWAKEHHELWFDDVRSGKVPYQRTLPAAAKTGNAANASNAAKPA